MTSTKNAAKACIAILLAAALSACATKMGRNFDDTYAQQIKPGETTKAEIRERLGRPPLVSKTADEETWTYAYYEGRGIGRGIMDIFGFSDGDMQGKQKRLTVKFKGDTVKESRFRIEFPIDDPLGPL